MVGSKLSTQLLRHCTFVRVGTSAAKVIATTGAYFWEDQAEINGSDTEPSPESNGSDTEPSPRMSTAKADLGGKPLEE
jgi:hypothetical protein